MPKLDIKGVIIPNDYKWYYDWLKMDSTCPKDVQKVLDAMADGEDLDVYINSPGGIISSGSEIYALLRKRGDKCNIRIHIMGEACSAASVIAMAGHSEMAPTALMMVHCVSTSVRNGNHTAMEHTAEMLRTADQAMCTAYIAKTGMTEQEALDMMNHETWLNAQQAKDRGLVDKIMFAEEEDEPLTAGVMFRLPSEEQMNKVRKLAEGRTMQEELGEDGTRERAQRKLNALRMPILNMQP